MHGTSQETRHGSNHTNQSFARFHRLHDHHPKLQHRWKKDELREIYSPPRLLVELPYTLKMHP